MRLGAIAIYARGRLSHSLCSNLPNTYFVTCPVICQGKRWVTPGGWNTWRGRWVLRELKIEFRLEKKKNRKKSIVPTQITHFDFQYFHMIHGLACFSETVKYWRWREGRDEVGFLKPKYCSAWLRPKLHTKIESVACLESFRALKPTLLENFRALTRLQSKLLSLERL